MRAVRSRVVALACLLLGLTLASVPNPPAGAVGAPAYAADDPVRIMLLGDSMTQGDVGDWTWRYRLWQHLSAAGVAFDLVGPRTDLRDTTGTYGSSFSEQGYLDPAFDRDHASRWGMTLAAMDQSVDDLMADHAPDVLVVELGDNDLTEGASPAQVADRLEQLVADARALDPEVRVVLCDDPRAAEPQAFPQQVQLNALLADLVPALTTSASPVVLAELASGYDLDADTYDWAHPTSHGELKIAAAVADALHELGVGPPATRPLPLAGTPRGPRVAPRLTVMPVGGGADVSWVPSPGATSTLELRDVTGGGDWQPVVERSSLTTYALRSLEPGRRVALRVVPWKGFVKAEPDAWSEVAEVQVPAPEPEGPARILLVGDSVTMGSTGDWTWRYRLWQHLRRTAPGATDLVGPRDDLYDRATRTTGHHDYADPAFDRDHAGFWGSGAVFPALSFAGLVESQHPDVVVALLGANDLEQLHLSPAVVAQSLRERVADLRRADPTVDVVLGEVVQTWFAGASELNGLVHALAGELDQPGSRVVVAETADGFARRRDTYDGSHPNARGELRVAAAVGDALSAVGVGGPALRPAPQVPVGPRTPVRLRGEASRRPSGTVVRLRWTASPGADSYRVLVRRIGTQRWTRLGDVAKRRTSVRALRPGRRFQFSVLPRKGWDTAADSVRSNRRTFRF